MKCQTLYCISDSRPNHTGDFQSTDCGLLIIFVLQFYKGSNYCGDGGIGPKMYVLISFDLFSKIKYIDKVRGMMK